MNKKKTTTVALTALLTLSSTVPVLASSVTNTSASMPTFSYADTTFSDMVKASNEKIFNDLKKRKDMLKETINAPTFKDLSLGEKIVLVEKYFTVRGDIYKENQKNVLSATDAKELQPLQENLIKESDNQNKDSLLISKLVKEIKTKDMSLLTSKEIKDTEDMMKKLLVSYKEMRNSGRNLETLIKTQFKVFNSNQLRVLNKYGQKFELEGDKKQALEMGKKILKLTDGDIDAYKKVSNLLSSEKKSYFFLDNEVVQVKFPFLDINDGAYIAVSDLGNLKGFTIDNDDEKLLIRNKDSVLTINKKENTARFNDMNIGRNFVVEENDKQYVPIYSIFELFHFDVKWENELENIIINKQIYGVNEWDILSPEEMLRGLFPRTEAKEMKSDKKKEEIDKVNTASQSNI